MGAVPALRILGLVHAPREFTDTDLDQLAPVQAVIPARKDKPDRVGTGVALKDVLAAAEPEPAATHGTCRATDYSASIPLPLLLDRGVVLRTEEGLRLVVPEGDTLCWNVKGLLSVELTAGAEPDSVPAEPPH